MNFNFADSFNDFFEFQIQRLHDSCWKMYTLSDSIDLPAQREIVIPFYMPWKCKFLFGAFVVQHGGCIYYITGYETSVTQFYMYTYCEKLWMRIKKKEENIFLTFLLSHLHINYNRFSMFVLQSKPSIVMTSFTFTHAILTNHE